VRSVPGREGPFLDVVASHGPFSNGRLFHELVHVEQYRQLGIPHLSEPQARGFLEQNPAGQFSVVADVRSFPLKSNPVQMDQGTTPELANVRSSVCLLGLTA
jgi:hypothetical protein